MCFKNTSTEKENGVTTDVSRVYLAPAPKMCLVYHKTLLTPACMEFLAELIRKFRQNVDQILLERCERKNELDLNGSRPDFLLETKAIRSGDWKVSPLPPRLQCRHLDLGDVSPSNTSHFTASLNSSAQGIQTDFDDGHCPSWSNQLLGLYNVYAAVHSKLPNVPEIAKAPILMLRPRAWNMVEHNMMVDGCKVPGPLFDFGILMFHNAQVLAGCGSGPFFYLSKVESYKEAHLWNSIFTWTQEKLKIPHGTIKACVLIENILASFEMDEILYELKDHSLGLNCGIWDYSASFVNKFGLRKDFLIPDRSKYVSMERHFLKSYMDLVIKTCHRRNTHATGGMAATLLNPHDMLKRDQDMEKAIRGKLREIKAGVDGFMVYDLGLVAPMQALFKEYAPSENQWDVKRLDVNVTADDLLVVPKGGVTMNGLRHNVAVGILFIYNWLNGRGHYYYKGAVEDSATAEISRSQIWQWIRHMTPLEDSDNIVTIRLVRALMSDVVKQIIESTELSVYLEEDRKLLYMAAQILDEIVTKVEFPEFITTYLNQEHSWLNYNVYKTSLL